jgi:hypothetical protein
MRLYSRDQQLENGSPIYRRNCNQIDILKKKIVSRIFFPKYPQHENRLFSDAVKKSVPFYFNFCFEPDQTDPLRHIFGSILDQSWLNLFPGKSPGVYIYILLALFAKPNLVIDPFVCISHNAFKLHFPAAV